MLNDLHASYAACVAVKGAHGNENADEDQETELCLRTRVAAAVSHHIEDLRALVEGAQGSKDRLTEQ